ncbi:MAG TPA: SDR family oxidoreductase [Patescibacteria group bacterium]|nr:SDR family oxidoreductase [Patescibacteria group bacterium]
MIKKKVVILGATGMLGSMLLDKFVKDGEFEVVATYRDQKSLKLVKNKYPQVKFRKLDAQKADLKRILTAIKGTKWIVNAIGITKPNIHDNDAREVQRATVVNVLFPHLLTDAAKKINAQVIQIATDCVFSGQESRYVETDWHDCLDVYGKTKSLGEVFGENIYHLRCSIIGPELKSHSSLLDWFLGQPKGARINGFTNHKWNGITSLHFAMICMAIIKGETKLPHVQHILPASEVSKAQLLRIVAKEFRRNDVIIKDTKAPVAINRTLSTNNKRLNQRIWRLAGYKNPPSIQRMVRELAQQ